MRRAEFNHDTACVDVYANEYATKPKISIYTPMVEEGLKAGAYGYSQLQKLMYDKPLEYADMVLNGTISEYVALCNSEGRDLRHSIKKSYKNKGMSDTQADMMAREFLMYDS